MTARSREHFGWFWIAIEVVFVSMLLLAFPAKASPIYECKSEGGFFKFTISEVLQETESTMTTTFEKGDQAAIVKKYRCERVM